MLRAINYCGLRIEYEFVKKDIKNINIRITPEGSIAVSAPRNVPAKRVDAFVEEKAEWIFRKMADFEKSRESMPDRGFYDGKTLYYLGQEYRLTLTEGRRFSVQRTEDEISVTAADGDEERLRKKYINWLTEEARPVFEDSVTKMLEKVKEYNVERPEIYIRNMKSRWGSCNSQKKRIGLNVQLMKADTDCIDQVVLHELVHFICYDHSDRFYAVLDRLMPDWKERKNRLETQYKDGI
ncbi:MAG: SprT family zinc-dependent metalloprotease [Clostridia bacterium]|nr:SprT family zinc-dependent metalloprotease [Clostridia bacterium]